MRKAVAGSKSAFAAALELWAESRERAIIDLSRQARAFADQGCSEDAAHFSFAARVLTVKAVHERARAAAIRATAPHSAV
jgi:hypothetical protein